MTHARSRRRPWMRVLVLAAAVVAAPLPALAGDNEVAPTKTVGLAAAAEKAVAKTTLAPQPSARYAQAQDSPRTDLGSSSFFKTKAGIITLVAVGAGLGYALYSTSNDRVKSPNVTYGNGGR